MAHIMIALYFNLTKYSVRGSKNRSKPVNLFIIVCSTINLFLQISPDITLLILIIAITIIHSHSHFGICITGNTFVKDTATNIKSAMVSNRAPNLLSVFVLLAIVPSSISDNPQSRYIV